MRRRNPTPMDEIRHRLAELAARLAAVVERL